MDILADKIQQIFNTGVIIDNEIVNFIKNYPVIINESNLSNDFIKAIETILERSLTEDELDEISGSGVIDELEDEMLGVINDKIIEYSEDMKWVFL